jgi:type I restriction enzyme S subunit
VVTRVGLGKVALAAYSLCFSQDSQALVGDKSLINPLFSIYYLSTAVQEFKYKHRGTTIAGVPRQQLKQLPFPLPPYNEQVRIVAKIEELFTRLNQGAKTLQETQQQINLYQKSILSEAFKGNLTRNWRSINSFEDNSYERKDPEKSLSEIPTIWKYVEIDQIETFIGSGITPRGGRKNYLPEGIPFIRSQNVYLEGLILEDIAYVSNELHEKMKRTHIQEGDVLLNITGASIGRSTYIPDSFGEGNVNQHVCIIRTGSDVDTKYLSWYLNSPDGQYQIMSKQSGQTRQGLNYSQLRSILIPLTDINEQRIISEIVEKNMTNLRDIRKTLRNSISNNEILKQSILKQAFSGGLVVQEPSDEPASVLLERIKAEKNEDKPQRKRRRKKKSKKVSGFTLTPVSKDELEKERKYSE